MGDLVRPFSDDLLSSISLATVLLMHQKLISNNKYREQAWNDSFNLWGEMYTLMWMLGGDETEPPYWIIIRAGKRLRF